MTLYEYRLLDELDQFVALGEYGVKVAERQDGTYRYVLYQLFSFYIERKYKGEVVEKVRAFCSDNQLHPYIDNIDLSGLSK